MRAIGRFIVAMFVLAIFGCIGVMLFAGKAHAQGAEWCAPGLSTPTHLAWQPWGTTSASGACTRWWCVERATGRRQVNTYCVTPADVSKAGGRVATIMKAADPLKSLQTAGKRFTILPLADAQFDQLRAEIDAK